MQQLAKIFQEAKVRGEATEALKHLSCDVCDPLKQPPARRQVAVAHAEMFNDVVSMDVDFWKLKERNSIERKTMPVVNIVDAASGMHIAPNPPNQTSNTLWKTLAHGWLRWSGAPNCPYVEPHRAQISRVFFDQAEGRGILADLVSREAHWHLELVENRARYLSVIGKGPMEDINIDEADVQQLLEELTDAKSSLVQHNGCLLRMGFSDHHRRFQATFLRTTQICHSWRLRGVSRNRPSKDTNVEWQRSRWKPTQRSERG